MNWTKEKKIAERALELDKKIREGTLLTLDGQRNVKGKKDLVNYNKKRRYRRY